MGFLITREPIFYFLAFTPYTLHLTPIKIGFLQQREPIFFKKICVIENKVVSLHAKIKENG